MAVSVYKNTTFGSATLVTPYSGRIFGGVVKIDGQSQTQWTWSFLKTNGSATTTTFQSSQINSVRFASDGHILAAGYCANSPVCILGPNAVISNTGTNARFAFFMKLNKDTGAVMMHSVLGALGVDYTSAEMDDVVEAGAPGQYFVSGRGEYRNEHVR